jgi:hypothetical protein
VQIDTDKCWIIKWKERSQKQSWLGEALRRRRSTLDCSAIWEEAENKSQIFITVRCA